MAFAACNGYGQSDAVSSQQLGATSAAKLEAAGFEVRETDGPDLYVRRNRKPGRTPDGALRDLGLSVDDTVPTAESLLGVAAK